jgi:cytochrome c-type biogenesis protein CcmF
MNPQLGVILLYIAFGASLYASVAAFVGARRDHKPLVESARNATVIILPLLTVACILLVNMLVQGVYQVQFVWSVSEQAMPNFLKVTALWGGQEGSLLFWSWLMSAFMTGALLRNWQRERHLMGYTTSAMAVTLAFFLMLVTFWENPFAQYWQTPSGEVSTALFAPSAVLSGISAALVTLGENGPGLIGVVVEGIVPFAAPRGSLPLIPSDGQGLNPLLRHLGMIIHPPMLYLGFVGFVVPFAFGFAALMTRDLSDSWIRATRRWTLVAWLFLSLGLILGGRWAYDVLGWGGYWAWDPVENAAFMPWLTGTAFLHSVMIQEKRGMLRRWNMILIMLTYGLVIVGTFLTRSGVLSSVHSFAQSAIGPLFFLFVSAILIVTVWLLTTRWDDLVNDNELDSLLSRETMFLLNNLLFMSITVSVAIGTFWPLITEALSGIVPGVEVASVGPEWYEAVLWPQFLGLIVLMGVAPLVAWKAASLKRLGKALLYPLGITAVGALLLYLLGIDKPLALLGLSAILLTLTVTLFEYHRSASARVRAHSESYPAALLTLFRRNPRRYGGYLIHLGVLIMGVGIIANEAYQMETQQTISTGQTITLGSYVMEYNTLETFAAIDGRSVARAEVTVYRNGREVDMLTPRVDAYRSGETMTIPDVHGTLRGDDFYVRLINWEPVNLSSATFKVYINPLIRLVWGGGVVFMIGITVAAWANIGEEKRHAARRATPKKSTVPAAGD